MSGFRPGDLVVCVDDAPCRCKNCGGEPWPTRRGGIYRVEGMDPPLHRGDIWGVIIVGIPASPGHQRALNPKRFRLLPKADETFTAQIRACKPIKKEVGA